MGVDISGVNAHLILTSAGSRDRDYNGKFSIRGLLGSLTLANVPMDVIDDVHGNISIESTTEMVNRGTHHTGGFRTAYSPPPRRCEISNVDGNVTTHFTRANLHLHGISGVINIQNDFGDTDYSITAALAAGSHRIVSQSGLVRVALGPDVKLTLPIFVATNCGTARTNFGRNDLEDLSVTYVSEHDSIRRDWRAFHTPVGREFNARFPLYSRPDKILFDEKRTDGLDLISRSGQVELVQAEN